MIPMLQKQSDENGIHNTVSEDRRDSIEIRDASSLEINGNDKFGSKKNMTATVSPDGSYTLSWRRLICCCNVHNE